MTRLGHLIARHRRRRELTMKALAVQTGVSTAHISDLENGHAKAWNPSVATLAGLGSALGLSPLLLAAAVFDDQAAVAANQAEAA